MRRKSRSGECVRVLQSVKKPGPRTNPYVTQVLRSLESADGVEVSCFTWGHALAGRYDVFHAHWPESLIEQRGRVNTAARRVLLALVVVRLFLQRIPVVRTVHNVELPTGISWGDRRLLLAIERLTRVRIVLNQFTPVPTGSTAVLIEHGHYRAWFDGLARPAPEQNRLVFFGKIRRYKNVDGLIQAFAAIDATAEGHQLAPPPHLRVVGHPSSQELMDSLTALASDAPDVSIQFGHLDDPDLVREVGQASLVVLPYPEMHNSGSVLAALSLWRPVLVPDNDLNRALRHEVGAQWVLLFQGPLTPEHLVTGLACAALVDPGAAPDLSRREWGDVGDRHLKAYLAAL